MSTQTAFPPWLARQARRSVLLVWWTLTLQLPKRYTLWRRARQLRRLPPITLDLQPILIRGRDPKRIRVPQSSDPTVSVIITSYGKVEYTLCCLASIAAHPPKAAIEVIVVDDATPDDTTACLAAVQGIRLIVNPTQPWLSALLQHCRACRQWQVPAAAQQRHAGDAGLARSASGAVRCHGMTSARSAPSFCILTAGCRKRGASSGMTAPAGTMVGSIVRTGQSITTCARWITVPPPRCWCRADCSLQWAASTSATRRLIARTAILPSGCASAATR